jgi:inorganic pyrophosphatase
MSKLPLLLAASILIAAAQVPPAPAALPAAAVTTLRDSLRAADAHTEHLWRDTPPINGDGTINAYIEIPRGDRRKWEFEMAANARVIDRVMPEQVGPYPINYGFVPQTVSYDGDPFDVLVLGPPLPGGQVVRGTAVGVMFMEDEKGLDSKVVVTPVGSDFQLTASVQREVGDYFRRYKDHEPGAFSRVPGWGPAEEGLALVRLTHAFFRQCAQRTGVCSPGP